MVGISLPLAFTHRCRNVFEVGRVISMSYLGEFVRLSSKQSQPTQFMLHIPLNGRITHDPQINCYSVGKILIPNQLSLLNKHFGCYTDADNDSTETSSINSRNHRAQVQPKLGVLLYTVYIL